MRFSNKAVRPWSLLTGGLLDCSLGTWALWEEGDGAEGKAKETQHFFQKRLRAGWGLLQGGHRLVIGESVLPQGPGAVSVANLSKGYRAGTKEWGLYVGGCS